MKLNYQNISHVPVGDTISGVTYNCCTFLYATIYDVTFIECSFVGTPFINCALRNVKFVNCVFDKLETLRSTWNGCDLSTCNFTTIDHEAHLISHDCNWPAYFTKRYNIIPENRGELTGWKYCPVVDQWGVVNFYTLVELTIPTDAQVSNAFGRKCRASKAVVKKIHDTIKPKETVASWWDDYTVYYEGDTIVPRFPFDENASNECSSGIHFFLTKEEATQWAEYHRMKL